MYLNSALAHQIQDKAHAILGRQVVIASASGEILAGFGHLATGTVPEALRASQLGQSVISQSEDVVIKWSPFVYEHQTVGVFGIIIDDGPITPEALSLLVGLAEVIVHQFNVLDKLHSAAVVKAQFLLDALRGNQLGADEVYRQADILQISLRSPQFVVLAHIDGFEAGVLAVNADLSAEELKLAQLKANEEIATLLSTSFQQHHDNIIAYAGQDTFLILKGIGGDGLTTQNTLKFIHEKAGFIYSTLIKIQRNSVTLGVGQYYGELGGLRKSFQDAELSLNIGTKVWSNGNVYHIRKVGMFVSLAGIPSERKAELALQIFDPLLRNKQLFLTVGAFLRHNLNLTDTATSLNVHRNTLIYRLDKVEKLIGLDPRLFEDALQIKLGLIFYPAVPNQA